jgi:hypothetical protein
MLNLSVNLNIIVYNPSCGIMGIKISSLVREIRETLFLNILDINLDLRYSFLLLS